MSSTNPNNGDLKYGIDWNADGTVDQWVPSSSYMASGAQQTTTRTFVSEGQKTVNVIAYDQAGNSSDWGSVSINCQDSGNNHSFCSNGLDQTAYPSCTCPTGQVVSGRLCVSSNQCTGGQQLVGGVCTCPTGQGLVNGMCQAPNQCTPGYYCQGNSVYYRNATCTSSHIQDCEFGCSNGVCLSPPQASGTLKAAPALVARGSTSNITWSATNIVDDSCAVTGNGDSWTGASGNQTSSPINGTVTYTLTCTGLDNNPFAKSVQINLLPVFREP
jgi:hypothetical protein